MKIRRICNSASGLTCHTKPNGTVRTTIAWYSSFSCSMHLIHAWHETFPIHNAYYFNDAISSYFEGWDSITNSVRTIVAYSFVIIRGVLGVEQTSSVVEQRASYQLLARARASKCVPNESSSTYKDHHRYGPITTRSDKIVLYARRLYLSILALGDSTYCVNSSSFIVGFSSASVDTRCSFSVRWCLTDIYVRTEYSSSGLISWVYSGQFRYTPPLTSSSTSMTHSYS